ncbi:hypothetical protein J5N97_009684 [Dioscorea zingiberensis]|uniref:Uncharacterized protein n=1 Tax=Dioscorea zingiberensis TaxID=325984 RepID=A0A9D5CYT4_9LILI|nr:hypothetical protein J5N97_009684 [Dioscorea zingiberensis]
MLLSPDLLSYPLFSISIVFFDVTLPAPGATTAGLLLRQPYAPPRVPAPARGCATRQPAAYTRARLRDPPSDNISHAAAPPTPAVGAVVILLLPPLSRPNAGEDVVRRSRTRLGGSGSSRPKSEKGDDE